jgi:hypothetical protein
MVTATNGDGDGDRSIVYGNLKLRLPAMVTATNGDSNGDRSCNGDGNGDGYSDGNDDTLNVKLNK